MIRVLKNDDPLAVAVAIKTSSPKGSIVSIEEYAGFTGGCDTCSYWEEGFLIYVNGSAVFEQDTADDFGKLLHWLTDTERKE